MSFPTKIPDEDPRRGKGTDAGIQSLLVKRDCARERDSGLALPPG
jgi:hypothetical protein